VVVVSSAKIRTLAEPPARAVSPGLFGSDPLNSLAIPPEPVVMTGEPVTMILPPVKAAMAVFLSALRVIAVAEVFVVETLWARVIFPERV
jgi:hypothetical protein